MPALVCRHIIAAACLASMFLLSTGCTFRPGGDPVEEMPDDALVHIVVDGDTLSRIANQYLVSVESIIDANHLSNIDLYIGQRLRLPGARKPRVKVEPKTTQLRNDYFQPRATWAVAAIDKNNIDPMGPITCITVHHSVYDYLGGSEPKETLRKIEEQHQKGVNGHPPFACIGYHFVISADGRIWEGRPIAFQGAHARGDNNKGNIGICLLGNFDEQAVNSQQRAALVSLLDRLCKDYRVARSKVYGHNHFVPDTRCPGRNLEPIVQGYANQR